MILRDPSKAEFIKAISSVNPSPVWCWEHAWEAMQVFSSGHFNMRFAGQRIEWERRQSRWIVEIKSGLPND